VTLGEGLRSASIALAPQELITAVALGLIGVAIVAAIGRKAASQAKRWPHRRGNVPRQWLYSKERGHFFGLYGLIMGLGVATYLYTTGVYAVLGLMLVGQIPLWGRCVVAVSYSVGRIARPIVSSRRTLARAG
jgi:hypothetical protein